MIKYLLLPLLLGFSMTTQGQDLEFDLYMDVFPTAKNFRLSLEALDTATTLKHLNRHYEEDWVATYTEVFLTTTQKGQTRQYPSPNDTLTHEQIEVIRSADNGTPISAEITYLPIGEKDPTALRKNDFSFTIDPNDAVYPRGHDALLSYLETTIETVPLDAFDRYQVYAVHFTIAPSGAVVDVALETSTKDTAVDTILINAICDMPHWQPARYPNGQATSQEFVFVVGDKSSCTMNVLGIKDWTPEEN